MSDDAAAVASLGNAENVNIDDVEEEESKASTAISHGAAIS